MNWKQLALCALLGATLSTAGAAGAGTVTYNDANFSYPNSDCTPGCTPQFQQVYAGSVFRGAATITGITFDYLTSDDNTFTFSLSTSRNSAAVGLSENLADNIGADNQVFYVGPLGETDPTTHLITFKGTPFNYDPAQGDLLLTITHDFSSSGTESQYIGGTPTVSRAYSFDATGPMYTNQPYGLETVFTTTGGGVPEPATWTMMLIGFFGLGAMLRSRRRNLALAAGA